jgi:cytochrome c-type biogenesis protein CcmH
MLRALLIALGPAIAGAAHAADLEARVNALSQELRCVVCQNQSVADSQAELAKDMKQQVREQLAAGKPEAEVIDFMVQRYGDFVRYRPAVQRNTALLWAGPALLLLAGAWALGRRLRPSPDATPTATAEQQAQALALLDADHPR